MSALHYQRSGFVGVITMDHPPVNSLGLELRRGIVARFEEACADAEVQAIVLTGSEHVFSAGADIREFGTQQEYAAPFLPDIIDALENCSKPVVAAISGPCMGGGLEMAMGTHFRVAHRDARIALPEVKLGILPGAGGTQRLPRLVGVEKAVELIVSGEPVAALALSGTDLFDAVVDGPSLPAAIDLARRAVAEGRPLRRTRDLPVDPPPTGFVEHARARILATAGPFPAPLGCLEAVLASTSVASFEAGRAVEWCGFQELACTAQARALQDRFFADRAARKRQRDG